MTLTQQERYLKVTRNKLFHLIACERYREQWRSKGGKGTLGPERHLRGGGTLKGI